MCVNCSFLCWDVNPFLHQCMWKLLDISGEMVLKVTGAIATLLASFLSFYILALVHFIALAINEAGLWHVSTCSSMMFQKNTSTGYENSLIICSPLYHSHTFSQMQTHSLLERIGKVYLFGKILFKYNIMQKALYLCFYKPTLMLSQYLNIIFWLFCRAPHVVKHTYLQRIWFASHLYRTCDLWSESYWHFYKWLI